MTNESSTPGEVRSSAQLGLRPKRASECGLTECLGKRMCIRCRQWADMTALAELLPEGVYWQDPLTPGLLRELLAAESERCAKLRAAAQQARAALSELLMTRDPKVYSDALRALDEALGPNAELCGERSESERVTVVRPVEK